MPVGAKSLIPEQLNTVCIVRELAFGVTVDVPLMFDHEKEENGAPVSTFNPIESVYRFVDVLTLIVLPFASTIESVTPLTLRLVPLRVHTDGVGPVAVTV